MKPNVIHPRSDSRNWPRSSEWYLHMIEKKYLLLEKNVKDELNDYEKLNQTCNLDYELTEKEILAACQKLKNNKASSYDLIRNEMLKSAIPFMCKPVMQAFNIVLNSGIFPKSWKDGIIIHSSP